MVKKYAAWAQLEGVARHVLRHTFSYAYLEKTHDDMVGLADILGHDNPATTQIYTQKPLGGLQEETEKVHFFGRLGTAAQERYSRVFRKTSEGNIDDA